MSLWHSPPPPPPFSYCSWGSQGKNTEVVCHSFLQGTTFCQTSPPWPIHLGWPHTAWLSFIELDKAVVLWSDWLVFCDYGFSLYVLWCPLTTPTVLLGFLWPWMWGISLRLLQQSTAAAPYLGGGVSPHGRPSWPWGWSSSSRPSCTHAAATPWTWGSSSHGTIFLFKKKWPSFLKMLEGRVEVVSPQALLVFYPSELVLASPENQCW